MAFPKRTWPLFKLEISLFAAIESNDFSHTGVLFSMAKRKNGLGNGQKRLLHSAHNGKSTKKGMSGSKGDLENEARRRAADYVEIVKWYREYAAEDL